MSSSYLSADLRRSVMALANGVCEYCLIAQTDAFLKFEVDHIISEKHGGPTEIENLALSCTLCNKAKGSDIASVLWETGELVRFFHPRNDRWSDHFQLIESQIFGLTPVGKVTARVLGLNTGKRVEERKLLQSLGNYPGKEALKRIETPK